MVTNNRCKVFSLSSFQQWGPCLKRTGLLGRDSVIIFCPHFPVSDSRGNTKPLSPEVQFGAIPVQTDHEMVTPFPVFSVAPPHQPLLCLQLESTMVRYDGISSRWWGFVGALAKAIITRLDKVCRSHHKAYPSSASYPAPGIKRARFGAPLVATKEPIVLKAVIMDFTLAAHVNHPGCRNPAPSPIGEWVVMQRHLRLSVPSTVRFRNGERRWVMGE